MEELFLDTGYVIAIYRSDDEYHNVAVRWAATLSNGTYRLVTTTAVLAEIGDAFARVWPRIRPFLEELFHDPRVAIVTVDSNLVQRAIAVRNRYRDKDWGLTDRISFVVMQERGIHAALPADGHFRQASFRTLLLEPPP